MSDFDILLTVAIEVTIDHNLLIGWTGIMVDRPTGMETTVMMFNLPVALKAAIETHSEKEGITASALVRQAIAAVVGFDLPEGFSRAKKYASEEERVAAQKERDKTRRNLIKDLLERYRKGELTLE